LGRLRAFATADCISRLPPGRPWVSLAFGKNMKNLLLIVSGFVLCLMLAILIPAYQMYTHPISPVTNRDYSLVRLKTLHGNTQYELRKGESKLLPYGEYEVTIPENNTTFQLFKNNRGTCNIQSSNGILVIEVNENTSIH
jgi:hypothetical protein